jgi:hypothetical protein
LKFGQAFLRFAARLLEATPRGIECGLLTSQTQGLYRGFGVGKHPLDSRSSDVIGCRGKGRAELLLELLAQVEDDSRLLRQHPEIGAGQGFENLPYQLLVGSHRGRNLAWETRTLCGRGRSCCHQQTSAGDERTQHVTRSSFRINDASEGGERGVKPRGALARHRPRRPTWPTAHSVPFVLPFFIIRIRGRFVICGEDIDVVERSRATTETATKAQTWRKRNNRTRRIERTECEECDRVTRGAVSIVLRPGRTQQAA